MSAGPWQPSASLAMLRERARLLDAVRAFFAARGILEVETPVLSVAANPDPAVEPLASAALLPGAAAPQALWLQTSPEFAMKRLLAAGSGPIWQLARVFRDAESGRRHNPEFSLVEWYRPGLDQHGLMDEVGELLASTCGWPTPVRRGWHAAFAAATGLDPDAAGDADLRARAAGLGAGDLAGAPRALLIDLLFSHLVAPALGHAAPEFLYDFPVAQAALARIRPGRPPVAERFELFVRGVELANGFRELTDATEQRARFQAQRLQRAAAGAPVPPLDERFLAALAAGMPEASGVALGFDRLVMLHTRAGSLAEVMAFPADRA